MIFYGYMCELVTRMAPKEQKGRFVLEKLVSIIMPTYNSAAFVGESIRSVQQQTYENWELIIADDCSDDETVNVVESFAKNDSRIKLKKTEHNLGPAGARNIAIEAANGQYFAFLDSDDIWYPEKLEKQIAFMEKNNYLFTYTSYEIINSRSEPVGVVLSAPNKVNYNKTLYGGNVVGNLTVVYNAEKLGKFFVPDIKKRNDFALWLLVLSECGNGYGMKEVLAKYRVRNGSVSTTHKYKMIKYHWELYRHIEKLSLVKSVTAMVTLIAVKSYQFCKKKLQRLRYKIKLKKTK